ncbi:TetR/AcrR family transcriptional regulator [Streptomyces sp. CSDS2]|uniref:TetR/AcrR family transcriptional regulator n=1 Tax=Streptomyces sp. CSDS2 TaxID=3055051 RepID=UPI0025B12C50|nr:TetR/AcrR family transcriptional regulator [Streptomyces sp. CSDS2]MDN3262782.1 TetR/AcrR family transcriptional regulator [Streptomyces sp. CSDS2]
MRPGHRRTRTRARLLSAAFSVFAAKGCGRVAIEEVCAEAGFSRGAFYSNFESLDALFQEVYEEQAAVLCHRVAAAFQGVRTGTAVPRDVSVLSERLSRVVLSEPRWLLLEADFRAYAARRPPAARLSREVRRRLAETVVDGLATPCAASRGRGCREDAIRSVLEAYDAVTAQLVLDGDAEKARERFAHLLLALAGPGGEAVGQPAAAGRPAEWCARASAVAGSP